jgi:antitoxin HicB
MVWDFPVDIDFDGELYTATVADLPEVATYASTRAQVTELVADAIDSVVRHRLRKGLDLPRPRPAGRGQVVVTLSPTLVAKIALNAAWRRAGLTKSELASRLGVTEAVARRLLDPDHENRLSALAAAAQALGCRLVVDVEPAQ